MYNNEVVVETPKRRERCADFRDDLKMCLLQTECCKKVDWLYTQFLQKQPHKKTPRQCLREKDPSVPEECYVLKNAFFECKRSLVDARRRFRGPKDY